MPLPGIEPGARKNDQFKDLRFRLDHGIFHAANGIKLYSDHIHLYRNYVFNAL